jgi:hypothetical protein
MAWMLHVDAQTTFNAGAFAYNTSVAKLERTSNVPVRRPRPELGAFAQPTTITGTFRYIPEPR